MLLLRERSMAGGRLSPSCSAAPAGFGRPAALATLRKAPIGFRDIAHELRHERSRNRSRQHRDLTRQNTTITLHAR
jgi:hypothetical protein